MLNFFKPAPPAPVILRNPVEVELAYSSWRKRVLLISILGYATFYFVRKNLGIAMPVMGKELGINNASLGMFLTLHGLLYGVSRFANGFLADRSNARAVMAVGLAGAAILNICFGASSTVVAFGIFWMLNGWFQGMGFPPCTRLMTHWFPPKKLATKMSIWNTSHSIGAGLVVVVCGYLATINWRLCFFAPAALALLGAVFLWKFLPDTPPSVGLPEVAGTETDGPETENPTDFNAFLMENVFRNKYIWLISVANFLVYVIRYAVLDWGPTLLTKTKGVELSHAGWMVAAFELAGVAGMLLSGWLTDRIFGGRPARTCTFCMAFAGIALFLFWKNPYHNSWSNTVLLCAAGFSIYGPQALVGIMAANLATKRGAATAAGLTGLFGYASTLISGWGLGKLADTRGWDAAFGMLLIVAALGVIVFATAWNAKAHGYKNLA